MNENKKEIRRLLDKVYKLHKYYSASGDVGKTEVANAYVANQSRIMYPTLFRKRQVGGR